MRGRAIDSLVSSRNSVAEMWLDRAWNDWTMMEAVAMGVISENLRRVRTRWLRERLPVFSRQCGGLRIMHLFFLLARTEASWRGVNVEKLCPEARR